MGTPSAIGVRFEPSSTDQVLNTRDGLGHAQSSHPCPTRLPAVSHSTARVRQGSAGYWADRTRRRGLDVVALTRKERPGPCRDLGVPAWVSSAAVTGLSRGAGGWSL